MRQYKKVETTELDKVFLQQMWKRNSQRGRFPPCREALGIFLGKR